MVHQGLSFGYFGLQSLVYTLTRICQLHDTCIYLEIDTSSFAACTVTLFGHGSPEVILAA